MSLCSSTINKFTITKAVDTTFLFTVKANGSTLPMEIGPSDSFTAVIRNLSDGQPVLTKALTITNALSGQISLVITAAEASELMSSRGASEDRYYLRPMYSMLLLCDTANNGKFTVKVPYVYVD